VNSVMNMLVVDDDLHMLEQVERFLSNIPYIHPIAYLQDGNQFINHVKENVDIVLLDINMPSVTGLDLAKYLFQNHPEIKVIFMSAFSDYAIEGYEYYPIDYLTKPLNFLRLEQTLYKIFNNHQVYKSNESTKIGIKINGSLRLATVCEILYVERVRRKTKIVLDNGDVIEANEGLNELEKKLVRYGFFRSHQSYLVSLDKIQEISPDTYMNSYNIKLKNCTELIKVSKHKHRELKSMIEVAF
jgi:two-component system, LytTR family, response regulator